MITKAKYFICGICVICGLMSCEDMLESDSSRQVFNPELNQKTDSVFYAYGIMQAMQQLADQYYFQNEMRGELVSPTAKASTHLQNLSKYTADASNKYDSVYLYYKVINNCNYYLQHRDTTLETGLDKVTINEYAGVASFRAWTYLQLTRQYGDVPYVTKPVTSIGQINAQTSHESYQTILAGEADNLQQLKNHYTPEQLSVPTFGNEKLNVGTLNWGNLEKEISPARCFLPLDIVLGDLYLELGRYAEAAKCYYDYLHFTGEQGGPAKIATYYMNTMSTNYSAYSPIFKNFTEWPANYYGGRYANLRTGKSSWINSFANESSPGDIISYIPMAVNYTRGVTTEIPEAFGYDYYSNSRRGTVQTGVTFEYSCPKTENIQVVPSVTYRDSARLARYYYTTELTSSAPQYWIHQSGQYGDARAYIVSQGQGADSTYVYTYKPSTAYVYLYRTATVWMHLAEAINRMGYPDAAFAVLKNGLHTDLKNYYYEQFFLKDYTGENDSIDAEGNKVINPALEQHTDNKYYLTPESQELLTTTLPFLAEENNKIFVNSPNNYFIGIHARGAGEVEDKYSTYRYETVVKAKIDDIYAKFNLGTPAYTKEDYINAVEDLLCDEYAMEFAFEGTRYSDLYRIALHKNGDTTYRAGFGDEWLSKKLENNAPGITISGKNCYLPFK